MGYEHSFVRILTKDDRFVCCGFLVTPREALSCFHTLRAGPRDLGSLKVNFSMLASKGSVPAHVTKAPGDRGGDIAVVKLEDSPPRESAPAPMLLADTVWQHLVKIWGFPSNDGVGRWARGEALDSGFSGYTQIDATRGGYPIARGYSGAPVWDESLDGVIGMLTQTETSGVKAGLMLPTRSLTDEWPPLAKHVRYASVNSQHPLFNVEQQLLKYVTGISNWTLLQGIDRFTLQLKCGTQKLLINDLLSQYPRLVITGAPGCGKTVFLLRTLQHYSKELQRLLVSRNRAANTPFIIPVYVELGRLQPDKGRPPLLERMILETLGARVTADSLTTLCELLEDRRWHLLLLLDGLNELPRQSHEIAVRQLVAIERALVARGRQDRLAVVVTSRSYGFTDYFEREHYETVEIVPLDSDEIRAEILRSFPEHRRDISYAYDNLDPKVKQLLSNPQNLDNLIAWCRETLAKRGPLTIGLRTRGALLDYCVSKKVRGLPSDIRAVALSVLTDLGYATCQEGPFFSQSIAVDIVEQSLTPQRSELSYKQIMNEVVACGLIDGTTERLRFAHHSLQQLFAARKMAELWDIDTYRSSELWHEPMVIMAGLLDQQALDRLLDLLTWQPRLYAYILANIHEPEAERRFLKTTVDTFISRSRQWGVQLWQRLIFVAVVWATGMPVLIVLLSRLDPGELSTIAQLALMLFVITYVACGPAIGVFWYKRHFRSTLEDLRNRLLPDLSATLRFLQARGAMRAVIRDLAALRDRLHAAEGDPRLEFITETLALVGMAVNNSSYMSDDEMLEHLDDPLVASEIDPERLSS